jgi:hypothetical protein
MSTKNSLPDYFDSKILYSNHNNMDFKIKKDEVIVNTKNLNSRFKRKMEYEDDDFFYFRRKLKDGYKILKFNFNPNWIYCYVYFIKEKDMSKDEWELYDQFFIMHTLNLDKNKFNL